MDIDNEDNLLLHEHTSILCLNKCDIHVSYLFDIFIDDFLKIINIDNNIEKREIVFSINDNKFNINMHIKT